MRDRDNRRQTYWKVGVSETVQTGTEHSEDKSGAQRGQEHSRARARSMNGEYVVEQGRYWVTGGVAI